MKVACHLPLPPFGRTPSAAAPTNPFLPAILPANAATGKIVHRANHGVHQTLTASLSGNNAFVTAQAVANSATTLTPAPALAPAPPSPSPSPLPDRFPLPGSTSSSPIQPFSVR